ncbi:MAG: HEAT repeat domain-containing protein [Cyanobacteria bacterium J06626_26]
MIWRSTLVFLTSLTALTLPLHAKSSPMLVAQSSVVDPKAAIDTGEAVPNFGGLPADSPLQGATSEQQIEEIKVIQQELKKRGYYNGPIDGIYGPGTAAAIQALRGQEGGGQPDLFAPEEGSTASSASVDVPENSDTSLETDAPAEVEESEDRTIRANATNTAPDDANLGDQVSPETGVDSPPTEAADSAADTTQTDTAQTDTASPGLGRLLWPGLALIAALGSFGIGFVLANRVKAGADDEPESPWGAVPAEVPQPEYSSFSQSSLNGHAATNGADTQTEPAVVAHQPNRRDDSLSAIAANTVSPTTRLAKVDVMDELVSSLQVSDPTKRRKAIWELGQRGNSSAVQPLVNSMVDADSKEKSLILAALSEIGIRSLKPMNRALAIALQDDNPDVRKNAIRDLTRVYDLVTQISQMLGHATEDEDPEVRRTAEWALGQLNRIREAPKIKSSLNTIEASRPPSELLPDEVENLKN